MRARTEIAIWAVILTMLGAVAGAVWLAPSGYRVLALDSVRHVWSSMSGQPRAIASESMPSSDPAMVDFVRAVLGSLEDTWAEQIATETLFARVRNAPPTRIVYWQGSTVSSACGEWSFERGPFFCSIDQQVYINPEFFASPMGGNAMADFGQAFVIAHEYAHYLQELTGARRNAAQLVRSNVLLANAAHVRYELQADCYAGVWAHFNRDTLRINEEDVTEALSVAEQLGNDTLQRRWQGFADEATFTHGSSAQRMTWFRRGLESGSVAACDTFVHPDSD